jgi:hypothetical protein
VNRSAPARYGGRVIDRAAWTAIRRRELEQTRTTQLFLNVGHALDHLFMLIFPTVVIATAVPLVAVMYRFSADFQYLFMVLAAMACVMLAAAVLMPAQVQKKPAVQDPCIGD